MGNSKSKRNVPCGKLNMGKSIADVPNEVIQKFILVHLSSADVRAFGMTGCKRFKVISDDVLDKRRKSTISNILYISMSYFQLSMPIFIINLIFYILL